MKVYVAVRFKGKENKPEIEALCATVQQAGLDDFCFVRDVENYQKTFDDPAELWKAARQEIEACEAFLIDVSDSPSGGRIVEAGIAYALGKAIFVVAKTGSTYKDFFNGIATHVIHYDSQEEITAQLTKIQRI